MKAISVPVSRSGVILVGVEKVLAVLMSGLLEGSNTKPVAP